MSAPLDLISYLSFEVFEQTGELTDMIRLILNEYPEGLSIASELIQNAEDANATCVSFTFDSAKYSFKDLPDREMEFVGQPALVVSNDALFSDSDFEAIIKIAQGKKKRDLTKIGRYGLGFLSVYHLTDVPCILSGNQLVFFDPMIKCLPTRLQQKSGLYLTLAQVKKSYPDLLEPFIFN
jgi:sacsin